MNTIFRFSKNSKTFDPHRLMLNLSGKINLKRSDKCVALSKKTEKNFKKSALSWNDQIDLTDGR